MFCLLTLDPPVACAMDPFLDLFKILFGILSVGYTVIQARCDPVGQSVRGIYPRGNRPFVL